MSDLDCFTLPTISPPAVTYRCPGEHAPIPRSVHLARLNAFYAKCRDCPHRHDTGETAVRLVKQLQRVHERPQADSPFVTNGIRGVYQNHVTRQTAAKVAEHLAEQLWADASAPAVVLGFDERSSSPDLAVGARQALAQAGCGIIDIGRTTRSCIAFTVTHLQAAAGIFVTGAGEPLQYAGLDLLDGNGLPITRATGLLDLEQRLPRGTSRPARRAGERRSFRGSSPYLAGLARYFHALRPLTVICAGGNPLVRRHVQVATAEIPVTVQILDLDTAGHRALVAESPAAKRLREVVLREAADLGVLLGEDGVQLALVDELGDWLPDVAQGTWLARHLGRHHPQSPILWPQSWPQAALDSAVAMPVHDQGALLRALRDQQAAAAIDTERRLWIRETQVTGDAIVTLALILQALSLSDRPCSEVWREQHACAR